MVPWQSMSCQAPFIDTHASLAISHHHDGRWFASPVRYGRCASVRRSMQAPSLSSRSTPSSTASVSTRCASREHKRPSSAPARLGRISRARVRYGGFGERVDDWRVHVDGRTAGIYRATLCRRPIWGLTRWLTRDALADQVDGTRTQFGPFRLRRRSSLECTCLRFPMVRRESTNARSGRSTSSTPRLGTDAEGVHYDRILDP